MNGKQTALMPGNEDRVGYWLTPPDLMAQLQAEFDFDFDACPYPRPAGFDGKMEDWGVRSYANPPFVDSLAAWAKKAVAENAKGKLVVMIAPVDRWISRLLEAGAEVRDMGRIRWIAPNGNARLSPRSNALFILRPKP